MNRFLFIGMQTVLCAASAVFGQWQTTAPASGTKYVRFDIFQTDEDGPGVCQAGFSRTGYCPANGVTCNIVLGACENVIMVSTALNGGMSEGRAL